MTIHRLIGVESPLTLTLHEGVNKIGRNPTNDAVLHDPSVSSFHAEVTVADDSVHVHDLQSTNGTFVDGQPVQEAAVRPGQTLHIGAVILRLETEYVRIEVPTMPAPTVGVERPVLPDGSPACQVNPQLSATHHCSRCESTFHASNLRVLKLSGSRTVLLFCPACSAKVVPLPNVATRAESNGLLARISKTIRLGFKRNS